MIIEIPDDLYEHFINFLDISQAAFTEEDVENFSEEEAALMKWIEALLGPKRVMRYKTRRDLDGAKRAFAIAIGRSTR